MNECTGEPLNDVVFVRRPDAEKFLVRKRLVGTVFKVVPCTICLVLDDHGEADFDDFMVRQVVDS